MPCWLLLHQWQCHGTYCSYTLIGQYVTYNYYWHCCFLNTLTQKHACIAATHTRLLNSTTAAIHSTCVLLSTCHKWLLTHYCYTLCMHTLLLLLLQGPVRAGYFAKAGAASEDPNSVYNSTDYVEYEQLWSALDAGPCPAGHYCPEGSQIPTPCPNATVSTRSLAVCVTTAVDSVTVPTVCTCIV